MNYLSIELILNEKIQIYKETYVDILVCCRMIVEIHQHVRRSHLDHDCSA